MSSCHWAVVSMRRVIQCHGELRPALRGKDMSVKNVAPAAPGTIDTFETVTKYWMCSMTVGWNMNKLSRAPLWSAPYFAELWGMTGMWREEGTGKRVTALWWLPLLRNSYHQITLALRRRSKRFWNRQNFKGIKLPVWVLRAGGQFHLIKVQNKNVFKIDKLWQEAKIHNTGNSRKA